MSIEAVCLNASTQVRRSLRIFSRSSGQSLAWPTCISISRKSATWLLISTMSCKCKINVRPELNLCHIQRMKEYSEFVPNLCQEHAILAHTNYTLCILIYAQRRQLSNSSEKDLQYVVPQAQQYFLSLSPSLFSRNGRVAFVVAFLRLICLPRGLSMANESSNRA